MDDCESGIFLFLAGRFADSLDRFQEELEVVEQSLASGEQSPPSTDECVVRDHAMIQCNIAACLFELGLYRKCVTKCEALRTSEHCPRARVAILLSRAYSRLNREKEAVCAAQVGMQHARSSDDVYALRELCLLATEEGGSVSASVPTLATAAPPPASPEFIKQHVSGEIKSNPKGKYDEKAELRRLRVKYMGDGPSQIPEQLARMVLRDLSHASGDEDIDLLLVLGNAQINYGNISSALEIFTAILDANGNILAGHLGIGSALALSASFDTAIMHFTKAITMDPTVCS